MTSVALLESGRTEVQGESALGLEIGTRQELE
jgi:hypothetical protein